MICQLGALLTGLTNIGTSYLGSGALAGAVQAGAGALAGIAGNVAQSLGSQILTTEVNKLINKTTSKDVETAIKNALRTQANAISPVAAPGNKTAGTGGPAIGSAYNPPVFLSTSIAGPMVAAANVNPNYAAAGEVIRPSFPRMPPGGRPLSVPFGQQPNLDPFMQDLLTRNGTRPPLGLTTQGRPLFPGTVLSQQVTPMNGAAIAGLPATGLPARGVYQKEANGCLTQWYFFDGQQMMPIDRAIAREHVQKGSIYRYNVFLGKFQKLGRRRMNPMNVRAFFRAGRRIDSSERICRKMFSEKRRQKTGTIRRKSRSKKK